MHTKPALTVATAARQSSLPDRPASEQRRQALRTLRALCGHRRPGDRLAAPLSTLVRFPCVPHDAQSHLDTMNSTHGLGQCLVGLGEYDAGVNLLKQALAVAQRVLGGAHPSTVHFARGLADARSGRRQLRLRSEARHT